MKFSKWLMMLTGVVIAGSGCGAPKWEAMYRDGKAEGLFSCPPQSLAYYQCTVLPVPGETAWSRNQSKLRILSSKAWKCGAINGHQVVEVWNQVEEDNGYYNSIKILLLETQPGTYRPVYHLLDREDALCRLNPVITGGTIMLHGNATNKTSKHMKTDEFEVSTICGVK